MTHTIVMYQPTQRLNSRTFSDFETMSGAMNGLCSMYETRLKMDNPHARSISYDIADLFEFLDTFEDFSMLHFNAEKKAYEPYGVSWIKNRLYMHLKSQETGGAN
eukprot:TRINITY_DN76734_c0_g1_i1.p1 TRINITY_DN76734_c0_g1~~TRINITY_DN76734_c0_g1_i1.p1  ORF type:complete len:105 (+),score=32.42 TRINITY_DN76734_c0_g1_i1:73-387(+)